MKLARTGKNKRPGFFAGFGLLLAIAGGCTSQRPWVDRALMAQPASTALQQPQAAAYQVGCPDLLEIALAGPPAKSWKQEVGSDGAIDMFKGMRVRVEGLTVAAVAQGLAQSYGLPPDKVTVRVVDYRSQQVFVVGQVVGLQRAVAYHGPETVLALLQRAGGVTSGAAPDDVYVVRSRIAEGKQPEVFRVLLADILAHNDQTTNIILQPQDQIFVGETNRFALSRYIPPWLKPLYDAVLGMSRPQPRAAAASS